MCHKERYKKEKGGWKLNENSALKLEINRVYGDVLGPLIVILNRRKTEKLVISREEKF